MEQNRWNRTKNIFDYRNSRHGFTLIEFMTYAALLALFSLLLTRGTLITIVALRKQNTIMSLQADAWTISDLLISDLYKVPGSKKLWNQMRYETTLWSVGDHDIGWKVDNKQLFRIVGTYDRLYQCWTRKRRRLIAQNIDSLIITPHSKGATVMYVIIKIIMKKQEHQYVLKRIITLRNRNIT